VATARHAAAASPLYRELYAGIEVVDEHGDPAPDGVPGAKLLITSFIKRTQPREQGHSAKFKLIESRTGPGAAARAAAS
jgi:hypothetical protein